MICGAIQSCQPHYLPDNGCFSWRRKLKTYLKPFTNHTEYRPWNNRETLENYKSYLALKSKLTFFSQQLAKSLPGGPKQNLNRFLVKE